VRLSLLFTSLLLNSLCNTIDQLLTRRRSPQDVGSDILHLYLTNQREPINAYNLPRCTLIQGNNLNDALQYMFKPGQIKIVSAVGDSESVLAFRAACMLIKGF
jgi:hypothetical protein